ncbi:MAG: cysteine rich repeat-containing protein [Myxococcota bacterium]
MGRFISTLLFALFVTFAFASSASAQDLGACQEYAKEFCASKSPGHARVAMCLKRHLGDVSIRCKFTLKGFRDDVQDACMADTKKLCPDLGFDACLRKEKANLSSTCKATIRKTP